MEKLPQYIFDEDPVSRDSKSIKIHFSDKRRVLSSSQINGGYREDLTDVFNYDEMPECGAECRMRAPTYEEHMKIIAREIGLDPMTCAGLSTAVQMKNAAFSEREYNGTKVTAIVTGGIDKNGGRAGDPADWDERAFNGRAAVPGTINIILAVDSALSKGAMTKAVITATEAKTAAVQEYMCRSFYSEGLATGSGTDGIIVISRPQSEICLTDAGQHSKLGEMIGVTVKEALKRTMYLQTDISYEQQHDVFARMGRFGITRENLADELSALNPDISGTADDKTAGNDSLVTITSLYAHLLDQLNWGMLSDKEAAEGAERLLKLMGTDGIISCESGNCHDEMIEKYRRGLLNIFLNIK